MNELSKLQDGEILKQPQRIESSTQPAIAIEHAGRVAEVA